LWNTNDQTDPLTWWKENFSETAPELTKVAVCIFSIPTSVGSQKWSGWTNLPYTFE